MEDVLRSEKPFVLCVDVGGPKKIGWANADGRDGTGANLGDALDQLSGYLRDGHRAALGFEAPIWTPARTELAQLTGRRCGVEKTHNRAWSAAAGACALAAALALMPWCLARIARDAGPVAATVNLQRFRENGGLFLWEAFVSGTMKVVGASHHGDARRACRAFVDRWPDLVSDIPAEPAINHAVSSAMAAGLSIDPKEVVMPALVVSISQKIAIEPTSV
jgi:hypothetical protein